MSEELKSTCAVAPEKLTVRLYRCWKTFYGAMFAIFALATVVLMAVSVGVSLSRDLDTDIQTVDGDGVKCYVYQKVLSCIPTEE